MRVVLSGGGTGGHIYPALALAEELREHELLYIGARGRMDEQLVKPTGLRFQAVSAAPLRVSSVLTGFRNGITLVVGTIQAWLALRRFAPNVVFATGGYASVPVGIAARIRRCPLVVYLPDVTPGWAVRLLSKVATRIATTSEQSFPMLPAGKAQVVGYPVRNDFWTVTRSEARQRLSLPEDVLVLLVTGASQGARAINRAVSDQLDQLLEICHVLHITGITDEADLLARRDALPGPMRGRYRVFGFLNDMPNAMAAADLAVMRSGASVLGELPASGLPAILVPGVYAAGHNQRDNAKALEREGAAVVLEEASIGQLSKVIRELLTDGARRDEMAAAMRSLAKPGAARDITRMLAEVAA